MSGRSGAAVVDWRRRTKETLVQEHGGVCLDCQVEYPPFVMQFDHRDPTEKSFILGSGSSIGLERKREEALKCDLVCANCHAQRTHRQRCDGCKYCIPK